MSKNIHFITYANEKFANAKKRILQEAKDFGEFNTIRGYGPEHLPNWFATKYKKILEEPRIGGYGIWRPITIMMRLGGISEGDYLIYLDAGCVLNPHGKKRFHEYISLLDNSEYGILSFQMSGNKGSGFLEMEKKWTTREIFEYFGVQPNSDIGNSGQYLDGILIMKKNAHLMKIINLWLKAIYDHPSMFTDIYNKKNQIIEFCDNRHEQSVFSILRKLYGSIVIDGDESWILPFGSGESLKYPIWAMRKNN